MTSLQLPPKGWREWEKKDIFSFPSKQNIAYCPWFYLISIWDTHISMLKNLIMWDVTYTLCKPKPKRPHDQNICQPLDNGNSKESPDISWLRVIQRQKTHSLTGGQGHPPSATLCLLNVIRKERKKKALATVDPQRILLLWVQYSKTRSPLTRQRVTRVTSAKVQQKSRIKVIAHQYLWHM